MEIKKPDEEFLGTEALIVPKLLLLKKGRAVETKKNLYQPGALSYKRFWNRSVLRHSPPALASFLRQALGKQGPSLQ